MRLLQSASAIASMPNVPLPDLAPLTDAQVAGLYAYPDGPDLAGSARLWTRANMVASIDGAATVDGRSEGLSSPGDRRLFWALRALADVIVVGAGTARAEGYHPTRMKPPWDSLGLREGRPAAPPLALVSQSLRLDPGAPLIAAAPRDARTIVITCGASPAERRAALAEVADVIVAGDVAVDLPRAMAALAERGLPRILCEGGPTLLAAIAEAGALDELCLTLSPVLAGPGPVRVLSRPLSGSAEPADQASAEALFPARRLRLAQLLEEDGNLFARYQAA